MRLLWRIFCLAVSLRILLSKMIFTYDLAGDLRNHLDAEVVRRSLDLEAHRREVVGSCPVGGKAVAEEGDILHSSSVPSFVAQKIQNNLRPGGGAP